MAIRPPAKKPITATKDGSWKFARPEMAWPDVQPPAYEEPNPTRKPPATTETRPLSVDRPTS